ncbi:FecR family protein [Pseudoalteromonas denitrificans]|uniref:FecR family protein n=1 Tax=Pseudoalteromonas denitrificans DSM 6059 TaxID=1123010 RepID=A0A1I1KNQ9_9GAMM|nr:FecR family protein [Pseudoalteromonas denitrificans]SFC62407.1 FecR family protein [Pseudoalteromonas denitrificans DSM 6059]
MIRLGQYQLNICFMLFIGLSLPLNVLASKVAGKTIIAKGEVSAIQTKTTTKRKLKRRSAIFDIDLVKTANKSKTQFRMLDGGMISLKENSELFIAKYEFDVKEQKGSVAMELLKGGLRSVTGAIKSEKGNYKLSTPIGSIGIRGTHYEIEIINGEVLVAVWDGAVDIDIDVGALAQQVSLGEGENFSYAKIDAVGEVTELLLPPENFNEGHSSDPKSESEETLAVQGDESKNQEEQTQIEAEGSEVAIEQEEPETIVDEDIEIVETPTTQESDWVPEPAIEELELIVEPFQDEVETLIPPNNLADLILEKTGSFTYDNISEIAVSSTLGQVSDFQASMTINFDSGTIPTGNLSFTDNGGEWFAAFNGIINIDAFEINVNFASHGNNKAGGDIEAFFINDLNHTLTNFNLFEIENRQITSNGSFRSSIKNVIMK